MWSIPLALENVALYAQQLSLTQCSRCRHIEEDEYCLIPMGGVLPRVPQRVLGIGGTAGMVHPSTGA